MSSNSILSATAHVVQEQILPLVPKVWKQQFQFGLQTLGLQAFTSANSNARTSGLPKGTAENKIRFVRVPTPKPRAPQGRAASSPA